MSSPPAQEAAPGPTTSPSPPAPVVLLLPPPLSQPPPTPDQRNPPGEAPSSNRAPLVALGTGIGIGGAIVLICVGIFVFWYKRQKRKRLRLAGFGYAPSQGSKDDLFRGPHAQKNPASPPTGNIVGGLPKPFSPPSSSASSQSVSVDVSMVAPSSFASNYENSFPQSTLDSSLSSSKTTFSYEELAIATNNFSSINLLGQGGFGYVHKGVLRDGKEVAVKQLKAGSGQGEREFQAEVDTISRVHHKHLVSLVGHCISGAQRLLVYEYVPNNTLEFHLHGKGRPVMTWPMRMKIAVGSAKGLAYLHEDCKPKIIHRDIKSANILIDENFEAKVADFGLARFYSDNDTHVSTRVMGTFGYLAPEYALTGKLTEKSDVFSFGVVLLELITGRRPIDKIQQYLDDNIIDWARPLLTQALDSNNFDCVADPRLDKDYDSIDMARMVACASVCVRHLARRRPRMSQVILALEGKLPLDELNNGIPPGHSATYGTHGSADYDASYDTIQYKEDLRKFRKMALESAEPNTSECSGPTSEFGPHPSGSSSEGPRTTQEV